MVRIGWNRLSSSVDTTGIFYQIFLPKSNLGRKLALSTLPLCVVSILIYHPVKKNPVKKNFYVKKLGAVRP